MWSQVFPAFMSCSDADQLLPGSSSLTLSFAFRNRLLNIQPSTSSLLQTYLSISSHSHLSGFSILDIGPLPPDFPQFDILTISWVPPGSSCHPLSTLASIATCSSWCEPSYPTSLEDVAPQFFQVLSNLIPNFLGAFLPRPVYLCVQALPFSTVPPLCLLYRIAWDHFAKPMPLCC